MPEATDPAQTPAVDTKQVLMDAAEELFAEQGVDGASLRSISGRAGTNLASVHYHFGSKRELIRAVLARRLRPLNEERLERLSRCDPGPPNAPDLGRVVRAFVAPVLRMVQQQRGGHAFARFVLRSFSEPNQELRAVVFDEFEEVARRFTEALGRTLPHLSHEEICWRFHFMVGSMVHTAGLGFIAHRISGGACNPMDVEGVIERLVSFLSSGLRAPGLSTESHP